VERAYLTDFGLARAADDATLTYAGLVAGTPHYMSPEQASGEPLDHRSDLFSLGSVLYFMATGHPPFRAEHPLAVMKRTCCDRHRPAWESNAEIPDALSDIIDRLLEKRPERRFASAGALSQALSGVLSDVQQGRIGRRRRNRRRTIARWAIGAAAILVLAAIGAACALIFTRPEEVSSPSSPAGAAAPNATSLKAELQALDPSPPAAAHAELDALSKELDALEERYRESRISPLR
jgi:serine/threonine protein kinase